ncbi:hypothetical protein PTKIN_Ptkin17bG0003900 [Pterospermum kingtungense]
MGILQGVGYADSLTLRDSITAQICCIHPETLASTSQEEAVDDAGGEGDHPQENSGWLPPANVPYCLWQELKEIKTIDLWRVKDEVLENGLVLKKMSISFDENDPEKKLEKKD